MKPPIDVEGDTKEPPEGLTPEQEAKWRRNRKHALKNLKKALAVSAALPPEKRHVITNTSPAAKMKRAKRDRLKKRKSKDLATATLAKHIPLKGIKDSDKSCFLPDVKDKREARLNEAYVLVVENGHSIGSAAALVGLPISTLTYHSKVHRWQEAKLKWQLLKNQEQDSEEISLRAIATKEILLAKVQQASKNLQLMQRIVERKIIHAISDTKLETVYDSDGTTHQIPVPKITPKGLNELADTQMKLLEKMSILAERSDAKILRELQRIRHHGKARKSKIAKQRLEIHAKNAPSALD